MRRSKSNFRTACLVKLFKLGFMKRSTSYGIRSKRNCMEMCPAIMRGIPPQKSAKPRRRATGQRAVRTTFRTAGRQNDVPASPKQLSYLLDLARQRGVTPQQIAAQPGVPDVRQLSKRQCSELINSWRAA